MDFTKEEELAGGLRFVFGVGSFVCGLKSLPSEAVLGIAQTGCQSTLRSCQSRPILMATAPPVRGKRSPTTANMVGQKKVLPSAYTVKATMAPANVLMPLTIFKPMTPKMEHTSKIPTGESLSFFSMKSAQKRRRTSQRR